MDQNKVEKKSENQTVDQQKELIYYEALVNAWIATRMEKDKQISTLAALGIGLIIIFNEKLYSLCMFSIWLLSGISFLVCIGFLILVFSENSNLIAAIINPSNPDLKQKFNSSVSKKTKAAGIAFFIGAGLAFLLAVIQTSFVQSLISKERIPMENQGYNKNNSLYLGKEGLNGIGSLRITNSGISSSDMNTNGFEDIEAIQPRPTMPPSSSQETGSSEEN